MTAAVYITIAIFVVILVLFVLMLYCAFEDVLEEHVNYTRQLQEHQQKLDLALHTTDKILEIQNQGLSPEETNKQIMEVLHEYESVQKSDS